LKEVSNLFLLLLLLLPSAMFTSSDVNYGSLSGGKLYRLAIAAQWHELL